MTPEQIIARNAQLHKSRGSWMHLWQELAEVLMPKRADFTAMVNPGEERTDHLFDGTPMQARRGLATAMDGLIKPKSQQWFFVRSADERINDDEEARAWFAMAERIMWNAIYSRGAKFIQRSGEVDNDLVTFGTGILFIGENSKLNNLLFRTLHLKDTVIAENSDGIVDTLYYTWMLTPRQAIQQFGEENVSSEVREKDKDPKKADEPCKFIWAVYPRTDRDPSKKTNDNLPFASCIVEEKTRHKVSESGYEEFPFAVPRWETASGEVYGRSPGMIALPDSKTLQAMGKTILVAGQKAVDPPLWVIDDAVIGTARTFPGGVTTIDMDAARDSGLQQPFGVLDTGKNLPLGAEIQGLVRNSVEAAFFKNIFNLPIDGPQMTATEVMQRREEFMRTMGPVFGQLESDYIGHIVERVFGILMRTGKAFPTPPDILLNTDVTFNFQSPIIRAKKQVEAIAFSSSLELLAPMIQMDPTIIDNFDGDKITRDMPEAFGMPNPWLRSIEARDQIRQNRQQAAQAEQMPDQMNKLAQAAKAGQETLNLGEESAA